jgi:hypothetical protein
LGVAWESPSSSKPHRKGPLCRFCSFWEKRLDYDSGLSDRHTAARFSRD